MGHWRRHKRENQLKTRLPIKRQEKTGHICEPSHYLLNFRLPKHFVAFCAKIYLPLIFTTPISQSSSVQQFAVARLTFAELVVVLLCAVVAVAVAVALLHLLGSQGISRLLAVGAVEAQNCDKNRQQKWSFGHFIVDFQKEIYILVL